MKLDRYNFQITKQNWESNVGNDKRIEQCILDSFTDVEVKFHRVSYHQVNVYMKNKKNTPLIDFGDKTKFITEFNFLNKALNNENVIVQFPWKFSILGVGESTKPKRVALRVNIRREDVKNMDVEIPRRTIEGLLLRAMLGYHVILSDEGGFRIEADGVSQVYKGYCHELKHFLRQLYFERLYQDKSVKFPIPFPLIVSIIKEDLKFRKKRNPMYNNALPIFKKEDSEEI